MPSTATPIAMSALQVVLLGKQSCCVHIRLAGTVVFVMLVIWRCACCAVSLILTV